MLGFRTRRRLVVLVLCVVACLSFTPGVAHAAGVVDFDAGDWYSHAVLSDGTLWGWGYNAVGQLGNGTTLEKYLAPSQIGTETTWADVSSGYRHTLALKTDGTLWAWGWNKDGQLGNGHAENTYVPSHWHASPAQVGTADNWLAIAAGSDHSVALDTDLKIWAWGANDFGQIGDGSTTPTSTPVLVSSSPGPGLLWKRIWATAGRSVALASDGSLWQWGAGVTAPTKVTYTGVFTQPSADTGWWTVSPVNGRYTAVLGDSSLWHWAEGASVAPSFVRYEVLDVAETNAFDESPQLDAALMIRSVDHTLWAATDAAKQPEPLSVATMQVLMGNALNWTKLAAGKNHFLISKSDGSLWSWGKNTFGQLGDGTATDKRYATVEPVRIILPTPVPDVVGRTRSDAAERIGEMGFVTGTVSLVATTAVDITKVISQTPAPDTLVMPGGSVNYVVSAGPPVPVPNVVGAGEAAARTAIGDAGLGVSTVTEVWNAIVPIGSVVAQNPVAGSLVIIDSKVSLQISKGPQPKTVPYTSGRTETLAKSALTSAGFVVGAVYKEYSTSYAAGYVTRSDPAAGVQAFVGDTVNIYLSLGKPKPWVGTPKAPLTMRAGRSSTVYGYLKPRHPANSSPVRIYKWKKTSSGWRAYGYAYATASNYSDHTKYSKSMSLPSAGKWRIRAYAREDSGHVAAWSSGYDYITVK